MRHAPGNGSARKTKTVRHTDLEVYQRAFAAAMEVFRVSEIFPAEEKYSLMDQERRSSRSVAANIAEAWRKRRYAASFASKLNGAEGEGAETQAWLQFGVECGYASAERHGHSTPNTTASSPCSSTCRTTPKNWSLTKR